MTGMFLYNSFALLKWKTNFKNKLIINYNLLLYLAAL